MSITEEQFVALRARFPNATIAKQANGTQVVTIPAVPMPAGWNVAEVDLSLVVPAGYPQAAPDCFWTSPGLRLENGTPPQNTGIQDVPGIAPGSVWFSWHPVRWDPNSDNLGTYVNVVRQRLREVR
ncbi:MAG: hypothetical protein EOR12_30190 [Mesorhizobium sp.]|uniref:E2/UBC family protein n=1 Tax=Mesorhizobium sp. TaxID=1871066 RepID=UPI000FEA8DCC|nr:MAG: hypothetical protein EOR12_30190 [Mesorhizobium sp.]